MPHASTWSLIWCSPHSGSGNSRNSTLPGPLAYFTRACKFVARSIWKANRLREVLLRKLDQQHRPGPVDLKTVTAERRKDVDRIVAVLQTFDGNVERQEAVIVEHSGPIGEAFSIEAE